MSVLNLASTFVFIKTCVHRLVNTACKIFIALAAGYNFFFSISEQRKKLVMWLSTTRSFLWPKNRM